MVTALLYVVDEHPKRRPHLQSSFKESLESLSEEELDQVGIILFFLIVLSVVGIVITYYQCRRLYDTILQQRQRQRQQGRKRRITATTTTTRRALEEEQRRRYQERKSLQKELREMRQLQTTVKHQKETMLQQLCAMKYRPLPVGQQQKQPQQQHHNQSTFSSLSESSSGELLRSPRQHNTMGSRQDSSTTVKKQL